MRRSFMTASAIAPLLILSACSTLPMKKPSLSAADIFLNSRTEADHNFILGELYAREGKSKQAIEHFEKALAVDQKSPTVQMRLSAEYLKTKEMQKALFHAEQAVSKNPKDIDAHLYLGGLYSLDKQYEQAISQYKTVLSLQPTNNEAQIYIASLFSEIKDYKKSEHYLKALLNNPINDKPHLAHYYLGLIYLEKKDAKYQMTAEMAFKQSLELKPDYADALISLANLYLLQGNRNKALSICLEFQNQNSFNQTVSDIIAQIYIENEDPTKAYEQFEYSMRMSETSLETQMKMAFLLIEQKKLHLAASELKDIVSKFPNSDSARYYLAAVYEESGHADSAVFEYMQIPPTSPHYSDAIVHAANILKGLGKLNQALDVTEKGLKLKAEKPQVYTLYATLLDEKSDYLGAAQVLEQGLKKFATNASLLFQYAVTLDRLGKKDGMIAQMKKVLEVEPNHVQSMSYLAFSLAELNQHLPEAETLARRALKLNPTDAYVLDTLGWVLFKQKKFAESLKILEKAYAYQSSASIIVEHLADAYSMQSMIEEAKKMYNKAVTLTADETRVSEIKAKLKKLAFLE